MDRLKKSIAKNPRNAIAFPTVLSIVSFAGNLLSYLTPEQIDCMKVHHFVSSSNTAQMVILLVVMFFLKKRRQQR